MSRPNGPIRAKKMTARGMSGNRGRGTRGGSADSGSVSRAGFKSGSSANSVKGKGGGGSASPYPAYPSAKSP